MEFFLDLIDEPYFQPYIDFFFWCFIIFLALEVFFSFWLACISYSLLVKSEFGLVEEYKERRKSVFKIFYVNLGLFLLMFFALLGKYPFMNLIYYSWLLYSKIIFEFLIFFILWMTPEEIEPKDETNKV